MRSLINIYQIGHSASVIQDVSPRSIYPHKKFSEIKDYCLDEGITLIEYIQKFEPQEAWDHLEHVGMTMYSVLMEGMHASRELPSKYDIKRKSARFFQRYRQNDDEQDLLMAAVYAVSEANAIGELVVSAPAYESCAILPGVLEYGEEICRFPHRQTIRSIAVAGLIGMLIATNSPTPEKTPNYQKELCSACAMTAAAWAYINGLDIQATENATVRAINHYLNSIYNPKWKYTKEACMELNAVIASYIINAAKQTHKDDSANLNLDKAIEKMSDIK